MFVVYYWKLITYFFFYKIIIPATVRLCLQLNSPNIKCPLIFMNNALHSLSVNSDILWTFFGEKLDRGYRRKERSRTAGERMNARRPRKRPLRPETPPVRQAVIPLLPILFPAATPTTFVSLPFLLPNATTYLYIIIIERNTPMWDIPWPAPFLATIVFLNATESYVITGNEKAE